MPAPVPRPGLELIVKRLKDQLGAAPGAGKLSRADIVALACWSIELQEWGRRAKHSPECTFWTHWRKNCTCGFEAAEERAKAKVAELDALLGA